ncbi:sensor histidine kinase KdpD [Odoribacter sp. Z80]|uniref:sensor histidine kinase n=1 Tax=Odoribacter sp. Z80 TaxID=2304575 RepID=UPI00137AFC9C|nr:HAMP domain-containing sensor histidine kinase [Odoribacter sp. Z80]
MRVEEIHENASYMLVGILDDYLSDEKIALLTECQLKISLRPQKDIIVWSYNDKLMHVSSSSVESYQKMEYLVTYDCLFEKQLLNISKIDSLYKKVLEEKDIFFPYTLTVLDRFSDQSVVSSGILSAKYQDIETKPIDLGYDYKHQIVAVFEIPWIFRSLKWHWISEAVFLVAFVCCLIWQWRWMKMTWQNAIVQTMGMAHLEHELKKPLGVIVSAISRIVGKGNQELTVNERNSLRMANARLEKMADVMDTMLVALKTSSLTLRRERLDLQAELDMVVDMFKNIKSRVQIQVHVAEQLAYPLLDKVYFHCVVVNLIDNGIKYGGDNPEIIVNCSQENSNFVLSVTDQGVGIPRKELKRIFRQFYRVKDERVSCKTGFGLGLTFVKKVVDAYHGEIKVESELGRGSTFTVILPLNKENDESIVC